MTESRSRADRPPGSAAQTPSRPPRPPLGVCLLWTVLPLLVGTSILHAVAFLGCPLPVETAPGSPASQSRLAAILVVIGLVLIWGIAMRSLLRFYKGHFCDGFVAPEQMQADYLFLLALGIVAAVGGIRAPWMIPLQFLVAVPFALALVDGFVSGRMIAVLPGLTVPVIVFDSFFLARWLVPF